MPLIHWWPLNGNTNDYGLNPTALTINNTPSTQYTSGKIGLNAYNFNGSAWMQASGVTVGKDCSFCAWAKSTTNGTMLFGIQCASSEYLNLYNSGSMCWNIGDGDNNPFRNKNTGTNVSYINDNTWHHYAVVCKGDEKAILYIDGNYAGTALTYRDPTMSSKNFTIGTWNYSSHGYYWNGAINDVRIYNHALSQREVKEIAKGCILHYDFEDGAAEATTNIDPLKDDPSFGYITTKERVHFEGRDCWHIIINGSSSGWIGSYSSLTGQAAGTVATRSCWLYIPPQQQIGWHGVPFAFEGMNWDYSYPSRNYDRNKMGTWQYCYCTCKAKDTSSNFLFYFCATSNASIHIEFYISDIQFEIKDHPTPYVNGSRSSVKVSDISGFGNHSIQCENLVISDSQHAQIKYGQSAGSFNANTKLAAPQSTKVTDKISVSVWAYRASWKPDSSNTTYKLVSSTESGGVQLGIDNFDNIGNRFHFLVYANGAYRHITNRYIANEHDYTDYNDATALADGWHHFLGTYDGKYVRLYIDGRYVGYGGSSTVYPITYNANNTFRIGSEPNNDLTSAASGCYFTGLIGDVKIYATQLTSGGVSLGEYAAEGSDIWNEVHAWGAIDKNYNLSAVDFVEGISGHSYAQFTQTGSYLARDFVEASVVPKLCSGGVVRHACIGNGNGNLNTDAVINIQNIGDGFETVFKLTGSSDSTRYDVLGNGTTAGSGQCYLTFPANGSNLKFIGPNIDISLGISRADARSKAILVRYERGCISVAKRGDANFTSFNVSPNGNSGNGFVLFAGANQGNRMPGVIEYFKTWRSGVVDRFFIPCKKGSSTYGMVDVTGKSSLDQKFVGPDSNSSGFGENSPSNDHGENGVHTGPFGLIIANEFQINN